MGRNSLSAAKASSAVNGLFGGDGRCRSMGTAVGADQSRFAQATLQGRYNIAYAQCMQAAGHQVPYGPDEGPGYGPPPPPPPPGRY